MGEIHDFFFAEFTLKFNDYDFYFLDQGSPNAEENFYDLINKVPWAIRATELPKDKKYFVITDDAKLNEGFFNLNTEFESSVQDATICWQNVSAVNRLTSVTSGLRWVGGNKFSFEIPQVGSTIYHNRSKEQAYQTAHKEVTKLLDGYTLKNISSSDYKKLLIWCTIGADVDFGLDSVAGARQAVVDYGESLDNLPLDDPYTPLQSEFFKTVYKTPYRISNTKIKENSKSKYDIVFISYNEPNAEENWQALKARFPRAQRVHGVKGIHQAHKKAAELCTTPMFWVVDGDAKIDEEFKFNYLVPKWELDFVHVWRSKNPVNDLVYGYGGVKLLPTEKTIKMDMSKPDMTTSISDKFKPMGTVSNITAFNTDPFNTWKSAFRECCKLASKTIDRQNDTETEERLTQWQFEGANRRYGEYAQMGAKQGQEYGELHKDNVDALAKINDFDWLKEKFDENK